MCPDIITFKVLRTILNVLSALNVFVLLFSGKGGSSNFQDLLLELITFRLSPVIFLQEKERLKITGNDN